MEKTAGKKELFFACAAMLIKEIEVLEKIAPLQNRLRELVIGRKWVEFEVLLETIAAMSAGFQTLEAERAELFKQFAAEILGLAEAEGSGNEQSRFYAVAARLPEPERGQITGLYRRLKMEVIAIKLANDNLTSYIKETKTAISGLLERAYPDRKGKIYSRNGAAREADMKSVLLNEVF